MKKSGVLGTLLLVAATAGVVLLLRRPRPQRNQVDECDYVGNEVSEVFHLRECRLFSSSELTPSFASRQDAIDAGYRPCGICKP